MIGRRIENALTPVVLARLIQAATTVVPSVRRPMAGMVPTVRVLMRFASKGNEPRTRRFQAAAMNPMKVSVNGKNPFSMTGARAISTSAAFLLWVAFSALSC